MVLFIYCHKDKARVMETEFLADKEYINYDLRFF